MYIFFEKYFRVFCTAYLSIRLLFDYEKQKLRANMCNRKYTLTNVHCLDIQRWKIEID